MSADHVAFNEHVIAVYDGRQLIGEVLVGRTIRAADRYGAELGTFQNRDEARQAIIEAANATHGSDLSAGDVGT